MIPRIPIQKKGILQTIKEIDVETLSVILYGFLAEVTPANTPIMSENRNAVAVNKIVRGKYRNNTSITGSL
jgi:hypothetical protein